MKKLFLLMICICFFLPACKVANTIPIKNQETVYRYSSCYGNYYFKNNKHIISGKNCQYTISNELTEEYPELITICKVKGNCEIIEVITDTEYKYNIVE